MNARRNHGRRMKNDFSSDQLVYPHSFAIEKRAGEEFETN